MWTMLGISAIVYNDHHFKTCQIDNFDLQICSRLFFIDWTSYYYEMLPEIIYFLLIVVYGTV